MTKIPKDFSVRGAAIHTGYTAKHLYELLLVNRIPGARKVGRQWRIPASSVEVLRRRNQQNQGAEPCPATY
jgi:hypothetical protein